MERRSSTPKRTHDQLWTYLDELHARADAARSIKWETWDDVMKWTRRLRRLTDLHTTVTHLLLQDMRHMGEPVPFRGDRW